MSSAFGAFRDGRFYVLANIRVKVEADDKTPLVSVVATFELAYGVPASFSVSDEDLKSFANTNCVLNAWPYWHEFLQSTLQRMNLPPIVLPLLTMRQLFQHLDDERSSEKGIAQETATATP